MPKVVVTHAKGLVQETGIGMEIDSRLALGVATIEAPAAAAAAAGSRIDATKTVHVVSNANDADDRIYLPDPTNLPDGTIYILIATEGFELGTEGASIAINDTTGCTNSSGVLVKELAVTSQTTLMCIRQSATVWRVVAMADGGAADAV